RPPGFSPFRVAPAS
uniref:Bradykinin-like peptide 3 n=2 Tax=Ranidae TaxID=8397 RepID=BRK3_PELNI|nr:RecName: Full=Bradykinin-like peptide 3 [Pelophylax nigromaculatus]